MVIKWVWLWLFIKITSVPEIFLARLAPMKLALYTFFQYLLNEISFLVTLRSGNFGLV